MEGTGVSSRVVLAVALVLIGTGSPEPAVGDPLDALVEVNVRARVPDLVHPWRRGAVELFEGSGAIVVGERVLTAAHVVEDHVAIEVRRNGTTDWFEAELEFVCDQVDLALLRVRDASFFAGAEPLQVGSMPKVQDPVRVLGFPMGGDGAAVTRGIVSRVEVGKYAHSGESLLLAQIDAAINSGSSGGPVIAGGEIAGVALQAFEAQRAEDVGYVAPADVVKHFLRDIEDGRVDGFPRSGIWGQFLQSKAHRRALGLEQKKGGVLVTHIDSGSAIAGKLRPGDVLLRVDDRPVAADGTIEVEGIGRLSLNYAFQAKDIGDPIRLAALRDGTEIRVEVRTSYYEKLVPVRFFGGEPPYLVFAGLVFQPLTIRYFGAFEDNDGPANLVSHALAPIRTDERREVIVLTNLLESRLNSTYRWAEDEIVTELNGTRIRDLAHLAQLLDSAAGPWVAISLENRGQLVFDLKKARSANPGILAEHDAARDRSAGLGHPASAAR